MERSCAPARQAGAENKPGQGGVLDGACRADPDAEPDDAVVSFVCLDPWVLAAAGADGLAGAGGGVRRPAVPQAGGRAAQKAGALYARVAADPVRRLFRAAGAAAALPAALLGRA